MRRRFALAGNSPHRLPQNRGGSDYGCHDSGRRSEHVLLHLDAPMVEENRDCKSIGCSPRRLFSICRVWKETSTIATTAQAAFQQRPWEDSAFLGDAPWQLEAKPGTDGTVHRTKPYLADTRLAVRDSFVCPRFCRSLPGWHAVACLPIWSLVRQAVLQARSANCRRGRCRLTRAAVSQAPVREDLLLRASSDPACRAFP